MLPEGTDKPLPGLGLGDLSEVMSKPWISCGLDGVVGGGGVERGGSASTWFTEVPRRVRGLM